MKKNNITKDLRVSFKKDCPIQTYSDLKTEFGYQDRTLQRKIKICNLLASYNMNSKFYTLPELAKFNNYGIWSYKRILFSRYGNLYQTLIILINQSKSGFTSKELSLIVQVKTDDALRVLCEQKRLQRQKHKSNFVYYSIDGQSFEIQQTNRLHNATVPQTYCLPDDKNIVISVLVEIIHSDTISVKKLHKALKNQKTEVSEYQIKSILAHYDLKKTTYRSLP
ncbi:MAG: hypothetical protein KAI79_05060 [Bacteroidales bacterium]|nr:hypothetical protein [Bacteroidales bacterium]